MTMPAVTSSAITDRRSGGGYVSWVLLLIGPTALFVADSWAGAPWCPRPPGSCW